MTQLDRQFWLHTMLRIAKPVLKALSEGQLKRKMPVEGTAHDRPLFTHLEALARTLTGMAPWLETGERSGQEGELRLRFAELARKSIAQATDPASPDYLNFSIDKQPLVDAAFLAHAILRAPTELWDSLEQNVKMNLVRALQATRTIKPYYSNWLLFAAMIEAALYRMGQPWDSMRVDYALKQHEQWYKGDGMYGDGPEFHWDYYNSFVIQPMLLDILETVGQHHQEWEQLKPIVKARAVRYAAVLERMISPEGTFPAIGRSLAYRFGAFHHLAHMALRGELPQELIPAQVRCALTAVIQRTTEQPGMFDQNGWLRIGFTGHQPGLGESYISTGSLYLCTAVFLPLGLPANAPFWQGHEDWTAKKVWAGHSVPIDKAL